MDSELVSTKLSSIKVGGSNTTSPTLCGEIFEEVFPYYIALGMSEEQFWDRDCNLAKAYRKAREIENERYNQQMWLMGAYVYDSLIRVSPIFQAFQKRGTKPVPYVAEPYSITEKQNEVKEEQKAKKEQDKMFEMMKTFMVDNNKKFKKGDSDEPN